ncbi:MFS transporter [Akkermansiaceae bacterium]|nr:MFS transporter [Akkermansiaceae bacterium]
MDTQNSSDTRWRKNFSLDLFQAIPHGMVETMSITFAIVIANKVFSFGSVEKMAITAASAMGFFVSLFLVPIVRRSQLSVNLSAFLIWLVSGLGFAIAAYSRELPYVYFFSSLVAMICLTVSTPLISQIHRTLYPDKIRGTLFSIGGLVRALIAGIFALVAGGWLDNSGQDFKLLLLLFAGCCVFKGFTVLLMDKVMLRSSKKLSLLESFKHAGEDKAFRKLLTSWMLLGFGNLLCMVLFVEYVTNPKFGYDYSSSDTAFITSTVPMAVFVVMIVPWGILFDKVPFYRLRVIVNVFFLLGILVYFLGNGFWALSIGMGIHALGKSGGKILWSLWVTKFAKSEHVSEYMSVHTFLTGVRGVLSPIIAYSLIDLTGPDAVHYIAIAGAVLIAISSAMLIPEILEEKRQQAAK